MSPDTNEAAVDKTTLEESMTIAEDENPGTAASDHSMPDESASGKAEATTGLSEQNTNPGHQSAQQEATAEVEDAGQVRYQTSGQPESSTKHEEKMTAAQQPETAEADTPETATLDTMPSSEQSVEQTTVIDDAQSVDVVTSDTRQAKDNNRAKKAKPAKRPHLDITPYLKLMVEREGSDMYFTCGAKVQIKINGITMGVGKNVLPKGAVNDILPGILNKRQLAEFEEEMELDSAFSRDNIGRFRINVFRQRGEVAIVIRQIKAQIPSVNELKLPSIIENLIMEPRGLIIIAGATGTGKSTTVASMIDYRNTRKSGHILTIEDPIEFLHEHKKSIVNQREVGLDTKSFKEALRRAMREAPDVIMIGEIRDAETMHQALSYADTGHLCIATLHATNTTQCMERIISLFPEANRDQLLMDLSLNLRALIVQRLLIGTSKKRVPATEVLLNEPHVKQIIRDGAIHKLKETLENAPPESPLHSFDNDMLRLFKNKHVTMQEAMSHADEPEHFKLKVNLGGNSSSGEDFY